VAVVFVDDAGTRLRLGPELGRGGEGTVFDLPGTAMAAKIYHRPAEAAKAAKLEAMVRLRAPALSAFAAWPERRVLDASGTQTWGIVLPKVIGHHAIHELYSPADRKIEFPFADWPSSSTSPATARRRSRRSTPRGTSSATSTRAACSCRSRARSL